MASICSCAAATTLSALAVSQLTLRLMELFMDFSTLADMMSMAAQGAPILVRKSSMASDFLK